MATNHYGWVPDLPDQRDMLFEPGPIPALPPKFDVRGGNAFMPTAYDQGQLGSCTGNAIAGAIEFERNKQGLIDVMPSRLFIYYNERAMEGTIATDSGAQIRDGIKSVAQQGVCPESEWPYDISQFTVKPSDQCYTDALCDRVVQYLSVAQDLNQTRACLAAGFPFVFGFTVYESFESQQVAATGIVPMPAFSEKVCGGHAVVAVGYDDTTQYFTVRNSWGTNWGLSGYFLLPYNYLMNNNLADDFWTIRLIDPQAAAGASGRQPS